MCGSKNILMVIAPEVFRDEELTHPRIIFENNGFTVVVASTKKGVATGKLGHKEKVSVTLDEIAGETYDAVVVVGGGGAKDYLWNNSRLHDILRRHYEMEKVVAAICLSGAVLAKAGLLKGKSATVWKTDESLKVFSDCSVKFQDKPVVVSGKIITGQGPFAARDFAQAIVAAT